jgi:nitrogen fixation protein FixH
MTTAVPTYRWIPWLFAALFLPVLAVNIALVKLALSSSTGLVSDHAFDTGQGYNRVIAAGRKQAELGWHSEIALQALAGGGHRGRLLVTLTDAAGAPLRGLTVSGRLYSPVDPQPDQDVTLSEAGDGHYQQEVTLPRAGQWQAQLTAARDADSLAIEQRLVLR